MIHKKEFYFIRHGQTNHNIPNVTIHNDREDIPLNSVGRQQAQTVEPFIATLPIKTICHSPLRRAKETKDLITPQLSSPQVEIVHLGECSTLVWNEMYAFGAKPYFNPPSHIKKFIDRTLEGINEALSHEGPVLIVAHGGIHWALCSALNIADHEWGIGNCVPVHFTVNEMGQWRAKTCHPIKK